MPDVTMMPNTSDRKTDGSISPNFPHRSATEKTANPKADPKAARLPFRATPPDLSATMIAIPAMATAMATQVAARIGSRKTIHPRTAAIKGAVANRSMAFATDVAWIAYIPPE